MEANILEFNGVVHSVINDVLVDSEMCMATLSILRICRISLRKYLYGSVFENAYRSIVCYVFIRMSIHTLNV